MSVELWWKLESGEFPHFLTMHSGKVLGVMWTFNFPDDLSFNLPLTKHLLAVISKKYVWDCQIFDIWMIKASIVDVMWCGVTAVIAYLSKGCTVGNLPVQCTYTAHQLVSCCVHIPSDIVKLIII